MSVFSICSALLMGSLLIGLFFWNLWLVSLVICLLVGVLTIYLYDSIEIFFHYEAGFWLFIFSEILIFGTLIFCCLYFDHYYYENLSSPLELPLLGCFVLLGSSITITGFHHLLGWKYSWLLLLLTIILGILFICLQVVEFSEVSVNIFDNSFYASSFCTVGLHFSHVALGVIAFIVALIVGENSLGVYRCSVITWYWHFVDYVWLFVYMFVYVC
uniref:Cytochrome c oxidase subunit 3 n=1 Tax=Anoplocephala perfoliata TaxID=218192 RepID=A0A0N7DIF2_9CEST|nr:cytochrome c oxidase subunit III [Anoplocephala perfoliata]AKU46903.1 cytochrome c oxidase subunit III [Anoplocephala perfoliata]